MVVVGAVGKVGLFGAVVAEYLSELAVCPLELAVCLLEAAVCPLEATVCPLEAVMFPPEALSRLLMRSTVVEVVREDSMEAAATVGAVGLPRAVYLSELAILLETVVCWLQALVFRLLRLTQSTLVEGLMVTLVKVLKVAVSPVSMSAK